MQLLPQLREKCFLQLPFRRMSICTVEEWPCGRKGSWGGGAYTHVVQKPGRNQKDGKTSLSSVGLRPYPANPKLQRRGNLHRQAATAQQLFWGWRFSQRKFCVHYQRPFIITHEKAHLTQCYPSDLHAPSYVWGCTNVLQNPKSITPPHGLQRARC